MTIGFRVKSGFAIAVALSGTPRAPVAVARRVVELCDPKIPETKQPYHAGFGEAEEDARAIARRVKAVTRAAAASVAALVVEPWGPPRRAALVVGSLID